MEEHEIQRAAALMSAERLASFIQIAGTDRDAIAIHQQTILVASALMPVACLIEIALRNAVCERLRTMFAVRDWLTSPPQPFSWKASEQAKLKEAQRQARKAAYAKKTEAEKRALDVLAFPQGVPNNMLRRNRIKKRQEQIPVTHGQLISQLTLFFWKRLFSSDYDATLWKRGLRDLFPNKHVQRATIADKLEVVYQARNRIAHHEPIYGDRLREVRSSIDFIVEHFEAKIPNAGAILARITEEHRKRLGEVMDETEILIAKFTV